MLNRSTGSLDSDRKQIAKMREAELSSFPLAAGTFGQALRFSSHQKRAMDEDLCD